MQHSTPSAGGRLVKTKTPGIYTKGNRYVVVFRDTAGKQRKRFARTLAEARTVKAALTADVKRGDYFEESKTTFGDYATQWIDTYGGRTSKGIRDVTRDQYRRVLERDAVPFFGRMTLASIRPMDMKRYAQHVASRGVSANTVRLAVAPVKAMLATAVEDGLIRSNPAAGLRLSHTTIKPTTDEVAMAKALSEDELRMLLAEIPERHLLIVEFLAQTGLRISEALALRRSDIDFGRRRVKIRRRMYKGEIAPPKTRFGRRDVPLSTGMAQKLWTTTMTIADDALVFAAADGSTYDRSSLYRVVNAAGNRLNRPSVGLHTLRHTCASILFRRGLNTKQVQAWLGHHSAAFTLSTYVHLLDDDLPDGSVLGDLTAAEKVLPPGSFQVSEDGLARDFEDLGGRAEVVV